MRTVIQAVDAFPVLVNHLLHVFGACIAATVYVWFCVKLLKSDARSCECSP